MAVPTTIRVPVEFELSTTVVRPGNKLVVATTHRLTHESADNLKAKLRAELPGVEIVILSEAQVLVYENDEGGDAPDGRSRAHTEGP